MAPPTANPNIPAPKLPISLSGRWRRDWRLRGELIEAGEVVLSERGLQLHGRRTTPTRTLLALAVRLLTWASVAAGFVAVALTTSGMTIRTGKAAWLLVVPTVGLPLAWVLLGTPGWWLRRRLQPKVAALIPWEDVRNIGSEGSFLELVAKLPSGVVVWGRFAPRWWGRPRAARALVALRDGELALPTGTVTARRPRSVWFDRTALLAILCLVGWAAQAVWSAWPAPTPKEVASAAAAPAEALSPSTEKARALLEKATIVPPKATASQAAASIPEAYAALVAGLRGTPRLSWADVDEAFLDAVPWDRLLQVWSARDSLGRVEATRQRLAAADPSGSAGRRFVLHFASAFLERIPPTVDRWMDRIRVGEAWRAVGRGTRWTVDVRAVAVPDAEAAQLYEIVGLFILTDLARHIEDAVESGEAGWWDTILVGPLLELRGIHVDIQRSTATKALLAWATGDFEYLTGRAWLKLQQELRDEEAAIAEAERAGYRLGPGWSARDGVARAARIERDGEEIGWVELWDASKVSVGWTLGNRVPAPRPLLLTAGSYVTADGLTSGLAAVKGHVENWLISPKMDGLVWVDGDGVAVLDLRHGARLPGGRQVVRPLDDLGDLYSLIDALGAREASAFQTNLLAADGKLTIDPTRASPELRERRLLVTARYGDNPILALVDIPTEHRMSLYEAARVAWLTLQTPQNKGGPGLKIDGIANLDVGSFNILEALSDQGELLRKGPVSRSEAKNLLWVTR